MTWKAFVLASGISIALAEHTGIEHSGCSQSGSIQPIPYVPVINGQFANTAELFAAWKASKGDLCDHVPNEAENKRGKEELHIGDYLVIKWNFESASTFSNDPDGETSRPSGFLRENFAIYVSNGCKLSACVEPATPLGSGEVLFPVELEVQEDTGVEPRLRYDSWTPPSAAGEGITLANPDPDFPPRPSAMNKKRYAITNLALMTTKDIPYNVDDELGTICLAVGTFISTIFPEIGSFQTRLQSYMDVGYWDGDNLIEDEATDLSIMVMDSESCSNIPPITETVLSGVSQILMAKPPPLSPPPPPLEPPPMPCPSACVPECKGYSMCIATAGAGGDCASKYPAKCFLEDGNLGQTGCAKFSTCYYPCTKDTYMEGAPPVTATCSADCSEYLTPQCMPPYVAPYIEPPCPKNCVKDCAGYSKCMSNNEPDCMFKFPTTCSTDCAKFSGCYYKCTKGKFLGVGPPATGPECSPECAEYLTPDCLPPPEPPCPPQCFEMCKEYAACMATLGVGCESLAMDPKCYTEWKDECDKFYGCYFPCTENKRKPKVSGSCSPECASYLVPNCFPFTISKDPHFQLPHGGRADFRGEDNAIFNLLSAKNVSMNVLIAGADFAWNKRTVHGTKMSAAYWIIRTEKNKVIRIEYNTTARGAAVYEEGASTPIILADDHQEFVRDNLHVKFMGKTKLRVKTDKWEMAATKSPFPFPNLNRGKMLLDVEIAALYDADSDVVAPHGIFGQAYDGDKLAVDGAVDSDRGTVTTTKAQAEGAIEGTWTDYKMASKFATLFKYTRFDVTSAKHRDVTQLTGMKHAAGSAEGKAISIAV